MGIQRNTKRVDLKSLFLWKKPLCIKDHKEEEVGVVYQRVVNDVDQEKARLTAIRKSREMRKLLKDENSDEYAAMSEGIESYTKEQRISVILLGKFPDLHRKAQEQARTSMPNPPSGDSMEKTEEYEAAVDEFQEKYNKEVMSIVEKLTESEKSKLEGLTEEELRGVVFSTFIDQICQNTASVLMSEHLAFLATYEDENCKQRYFNDFSDFEELAPQVKDQLVKGYRELSIPPEQIKN